jgi:hypothetical protein
MMTHGRQQRDTGHGQHAVTAVMACTDDGWPVLTAGLDRQRKLEGASGRVPDEVSGGGAHLSGMPTVRGSSSGGRLHTSTPDVEVVAGGDLGKVLWLGGGYAVNRAEPIWKRRRGCGAHRGGKWQRRFDANLARAAALQRSRPMHGLYGEMRKGCRRALVPNMAAERKKDGGHQRLLTDKKREKGGVRRGRCHTEEGGGGPVERDMEGWRMGPGVQQLHGSSGDGRWSGSIWRRAKAGERAVRVGCT